MGAVYHRVAEGYRDGVNGARGRAAVALGLYAGLLGIVHGLFALGQGQRAPGSLMITAIGPPCQPEATWHACLPALTIAPNFFVTGMLAVIVGALILWWATTLGRQRKGGVVMLILALALLLVGGGFVPAFVGLVASTAVSRFSLILTRLPATLLHAAAKLWPWPLVIFVGWALGGWLLGTFFNQTMLALGGLSFVLFDVMLPVLCLVCAMAVDGQETADFLPEMRT